MEVTEEYEAGSRAVPIDGQRLRWLRQKRAMLTQAELGRLAGVTRGAVSHLEVGRRQPMVTTLRGLCTALGCEPEDLILDSEGIPYNDATAKDAAKENSQRAAV